MKQPLVSVIVPVYNVEKYLSRCLDSLTNQTLKDIEIICVNDESPDNSLKILEEYAQKDERVKIHNQKNTGLSGARNTGMKLATGEYIGFVDSDDWVDLDFYEKLYNNAVEHNADIACGGIIREKAHKRAVLLGYDTVKTETDLKEKFLLSGMPKHSYVWNKIYKREKIINSQIYFPVGQNYEDMVFSPQAFEIIGKAVFVPDIAYHYWKNKDSIIAKGSDKNRYDYVKSTHFLRAFCERIGVDPMKDRKYLTKKTYYFCKIKILKILKLRTVTEYYLFGFIPFLICEEEN